MYIYIYVIEHSFYNIHTDAASQPGGQPGRPRAPPRRGRRRPPAEPRGPLDLILRSGLSRKFGSEMVPEAENLSKLIGASQGIRFRPRFCPKVVRKPKFCPPELERSSSGPLGTEPKRAQQNEQRAQTEAPKMAAEDELPTQDVHVSVQMFVLT